MEHQGDGGASRGERDASPLRAGGRKLYALLSSSGLAMALLVAILASCLAGVTVWRGAEAGRLIFSSYWFNGLLVLLVANVGFCFAGRTRRRKMTVVNFGMALFHLSFVTMFLGIVYNSLFQFRGSLRLTEGETLATGDEHSYDYADRGRLFSYSRLRGKATLVRMHTGYKVDGVDKRAAYEVEVSRGYSRRKGVIYVTQNLELNGVDYIQEKEGYSVRVDLFDRHGAYVYGAILPLQSFRQGEGSFRYATGTKERPENIPFPQWADKPLLGLLLTYRPSAAKERSGEAVFEVWKLGKDGLPEEEPSFQGAAAVGTRFDAGDYRLCVSEVRYWAAMTVNSQPGKPIVLTSLWAGLGGMVLTALGRLKRRTRADAGPEAGAP